jgi:hypothetical protein
MSVRNICEFEEFAKGLQGAPEARQCGEILLEWDFEQLKATGNIERLLKFRIGKKSNPTCPKSV